MKGFKVTSANFKTEEFGRYIYADDEIVGVSGIDHVSDNVIDFIELTHRMIELYSRKNRDYGDSFGKSLDEDGLLVSKIRLGDKLGRLSSYIKNGELVVGDESVKDTLIDLANYSIMTLAWLEKQESGLEDGAQK